MVKAFANSRIQNKSERPVDALAVKKYQSLTESLSDNFNQEMLAHLKRQIFEGSTQFVLSTLVVASNLLPTLNFPNPLNLFARVRLCKYRRA